MHCCRAPANIKYVRYRVGYAGDVFLHDVVEADRPGSRVVEEGCVGVDGHPTIPDDAPVRGLGVEGQHSADRDGVAVVVPEVA